LIMLWEMALRQAAPPATLRLYWPANKTTNTL
jgi:hypothetical protein